MNVIRQGQTRKCCIWFSYQYWGQTRGFIIPVLAWLNTWLVKAVQLLWREGGFLAILSLFIITNALYADNLVMFLPAVLVFSSCWRFNIKKNDIFKWRFGWSHSLAQDCWMEKVDLFIWNWVRKVYLLKSHITHKCIPLFLPPLCCLALISVEILSWNSRNHSHSNSGVQIVHQAVLQKCYAAQRNTDAYRRNCFKLFHRLQNPPTLCCFTGQENIKHLLTW